MALGQRQTPLSLHKYSVVDEGGGWNPDPSNFMGH